MDVKEQLMQISDLFYEDRVKEGVDSFIECVGVFAKVPAFGEFINPVFDALEREDYLYVADILRYEMAVLV